MPSFAMTVPYMRTSPLYVPRRDLVLSQSDSLYLRMTVVDNDSACAQALEQSGGIGGPGAIFTVWTDSRYRGLLDYGWTLPIIPRVLSTIPGTAVPGVAGAFDFTLSSGTMQCWPARCGWCVQLTYDTQGADVLMTGSLHVRYGGTPFALPPTSLVTDTCIPITTDVLEPVLA